MYKSLLAVSLMLPAAVSAEQLWLTVDKDTLPTISSLNGYALVSDVKGFAASPAAVIRIDSDQQDLLTALMHDDFFRCPGYMVHNSREDAEQAILAAQLKTDFTAPSLTAKSDIPNWLGQVQESRITDMIRSLSNFTNRFYTTTHGVNSANYIHDEWQSLASGRSDMTVEKYNHRDWPQDSVILTFKGHTKPDEIVVIGGHLDSTVGRSTGENTRAPGADDNASGIATFTEVIRVLASQPNFKPDRTLQFMGYAAEEVGLKGSAEIAAEYKNTNKDVKGVLQLDMTNYHGSMDDFYFISDYTNDEQTRFLKSLVSEYLPEYRANSTACGYACSDHASWHRNGFPASMPSESKFGEHNKAIHTVNDTLAQSGHAAAHAFKFAKLALVYAVEMTDLGGDSLESPVAGFSYSKDGSTVAFTDQSTDDKGIVDYRWSFGDGNESTMTSPRHTYSSAGTYSVRLTVTDADGLSDMATKEVTISQTCLLSESAPEWSETTSYSMGDRVRYNGSIYEAIWWSTGARPDIYTNVWKKVGDGDDDDDTGCKNEPPQSRFSFDVNDLKVTFSNQSSDDKGVVSHLWTFGDGQSSTAEAPSHTYRNYGEYTVTLKVTDEEGLSSTLSESIVLKDSGNPDNCSEPAWLADKVYLSGDIVSHQGKRYKARWWTRGKDPATSGQWGGWEALGACSVN
ncbi:M20/M25/M40 family metallo-hydrolase [Veronia pacifica]|uniref:PKD domain-containing protein n=1 Tax=Veronia pacifica TaxID=1080227 RepID=A0A1C3EQ79_9GAMM|nr:M20/M25/M40 family metallo-hydrolase [Veronia pacifica]ODA35349.1 hypothetical protein A8L45_04075 [Veronia pacifica]